MSAVTAVPTLPAVGVESPARRARLLAACAVALVAIALSLHVQGQLANRHAGPDLWQHWYAARALLHGESPYTAITGIWRWPYYYPLPAALVALPLAPLTREWATAVFVGLSLGLLAFALTRRAWWPMVWLASGPVLFAGATGQWSPILTASALLPALGALWVVKPTIGLAMAAGYLTRPAVIGGAALVAVSLIVDPHWPVTWFGITRDAPHVVAPVMRPGGVLLLLAALKWRRPEARMLAALACVPVTGALYELVPLGLIPQTRREMLLLTALGQVAILVQPAPPPDSQFVQGLARDWPLLLLLYLPALVMVLRRPNVMPDASPPA